MRAQSFNPFGVRAISSVGFSRTVGYYSIREVTDRFQTLSALGLLIGTAAALTYYSRTTLSHYDAKEHLVVGAGCSTA